MPILTNHWSNIMENQQNKVIPTHTKAKEVKEIAQGCIEVGMCYNDYCVVAGNEEKILGFGITVSKARYLELCNELGFGA